MADPYDLYREEPDSPRLFGSPERPTPAPAWGATGAFVRHGVRSAAPTAGGFAAFAPGATLGGEIGSVGGPLGAGAGALIGGLVTSTIGSNLTERAQNWLFDHLGEDTLRALGQDQATVAADEALHPRASFLGSLAPQALFLKPGVGSLKMMGVGAGVAAGVEAGSELADTGTVDPFKVAAQAVGGAFLNRPTKVGAAVQSSGERLARTIATGHGSTLAEAAADEVHAATPEGVPEDERGPDEKAAAIVREDAALTRTSNPYVDNVPGAATHGERLSNALTNAARGLPPEVPAPAPRPATPLDRDAWHASVLHVESRGDPNAVSAKGATGRMQVMPGTARDPGFGVRPAADESAAEIERVGHDYLDALERHYDGDQVLATAAYNGGVGRVDRWLKTIGDPRKGEISNAEWAERIPIKETRDYVRKVYARAGHDLPEQLQVRPDAYAEDAADPPTDLPPLRDASDEGRFGPVHVELADNWRGAVERLTADRAGEVPGALYHPATGPIDLVWGDEKGGLAHIAAEHPDVVDRLPDLLPTMEVASRSRNRVRLESPDHMAVARLDYDGERKTWLLTAFRKSEEAPASAEDGRARAGGRDGSPGLGEERNIAPTMKKVTTVKRGDFYEIEGEHARGAAEALDVGTTYSRKGVETFGMPAHAARRWAEQLREHGYDVRLDGEAAPEAPPPDALERFDDPAGEGAEAQTALIEHDLRAAIEADPALTARLDENGDVVNVADLLAGFDDELRQNEALRACLAPKGTA